MTTKGQLAVRRLDLKPVCDVCGRPRSSGDNTYKHTKCSLIRKARYAEREKS